ncbi:MAG TPA: hypothetical protein VFX43_14500, partial [Chitinophagaceae bacterium]|nr:hypothetical protein [Chitinophagaceae bacterium]
MRMLPSGQLSRCAYAGLHALVQELQVCRKIDLKLLKSGLQGNIRFELDHKALGRLGVTTDKQLIKIGKLPDIRQTDLLNLILSSFDILCFKSNAWQIFRKNTLPI